MELSSVAYWEHSLVISEVAIRGHHVPVGHAKGQTGPEESWSTGERGFSHGLWLHRLCNHGGFRWHHGPRTYRLHRSPASRRRRTPHPLPHLLQALAPRLPGCDGGHSLSHAHEHLGWTLLPPRPNGAAQGPGLERGAVRVCAGWPDGYALPREGHGGGPATAEGVCRGLRGEGHLSWHTRQGRMGKCNWYTISVYINKLLNTLQNLLPHVKQQWKPSFLHCSDLVLHFHSHQGHVRDRFKKEWSLVQAPEPLDPTLPHTFEHWLFSM